MCLFPITIRVKTSVMKGYEHGMPLPVQQYRTVPCGKCYDCRRAAATRWRFRLFQEMNLGGHSNSLFVTLTLDDKYFNQAVDPAIYIRRFLDRLRKVYGRSVKHWFIHEYGSSPSGTHRLHFHGFLWDFPDRVVRTRTGSRLPSLREIAKMPSKEARSHAYRSFNDEVLNPLWGYGFSYIGHTCDVSTALYVTKYITKGYLDYYSDSSHWTYPPRIYCSAGIGRCFLSTLRGLRYRLRHGPVYFLIGTCRYRLPVYYERKILSSSDYLIRQYYRPPSYEDEDPSLWVVQGVRYDSYDSYVQARLRARSLALSKNLGPRTLAVRRRLTYYDYLCLSLTKQQSRASARRILTSQQSAPLTQRLESLLPFTTAQRSREISSLLKRLKA